MPRLQFAFIKRAGTFFLNGAWDRINFYAKGRPICYSACVARKIYMCEPLTNHFERSAANGIFVALWNNDFGSARGLAEMGQLPNANPDCVNLIKLIIEVGAFPVSDPTKALP